MVLKLRFCHEHKHIPSSAVADHAKFTAVRCWCSADQRPPWKFHSASISRLSVTPGRNVCASVCVCCWGYWWNCQKQGGTCSSLLFIPFFSVALLFSLFLSEVLITLSSVLLHLMRIIVPKYRHTETYCCCSDSGLSCSWQLCVGGRATWNNTDKWSEKNSIINVSVWNR